MVISEYSPKSFPNINFAKFLTNENPKIYLILNKWVLSSYFETEWKFSRHIWILFSCYFNVSCTFFISRQQDFSTPTVEEKVLLLLSAKIIFHAFPRFPYLSNIYNTFLKVVQNGFISVTLLFFNILSAVDWYDNFCFFKELSQSINKLGVHILSS